MRPVVLALMLSWLPVTENCLGTPLVSGIDHYEVTGQHVRVLGYVSVDGFAAPVYSERAPQFIRAPQPVVTLSEAPLLPGDVVWWDVVAVDAQGNRSEECLP